MNYQPFLDANLLISDPLLAELHLLKPVFALMVIFSFYLLFALHITIYRLYKTMRAPKRNYPAHKSEVASNV